MKPCAVESFFVERVLITNAISLIDVEYSVVLFLLCLFQLSFF